MFFDSKLKLSSGLTHILDATFVAWHQVNNTNSVTVKISCHLETFIIVVTSEFIGNINVRARFTWFVTLCHSQLLIVWFCTFEGCLALTSMFLRFGGCLNVNIGGSGKTLLSWGSFVIVTQCFRTTFETLVSLGWYLKVKITLYVCGFLTFLRITFLSRRIFF